MSRKLYRFCITFVALICTCVITTSTFADDMKEDSNAQQAVQEFIDQTGFEEPVEIREKIMNEEVRYLLDEQAAALLNADRQAIADNLYGAMANQESLFYDKAIELGLDPVFVVALAAHETGNGSSYLAINNHNFGGMRGGDGWMAFSSKEDGIMAYLNLLASYKAKGLDIPEKMVSRYAPNSPTWVGVIRGTMAHINKDIQRARNEVNSYYATLAKQ